MQQMKSPQEQLMLTVNTAFSRGENESICYIKGTVAFVNSFKFHIELY